MRIGRLRIARFKSIRELELACRKVNVFIGPPDTGKTNILEALNLLSRLGWSLPLDTSFRLVADQGFEPLFFHQFFDQPIEIALDDDVIWAGIRGADRKLNIQNRRGSVDLAFGNAADSHSFSWLQGIRHYAYSGAASWQYDSNSASGDSVVATPDGPNLTYIARHNKTVYEFLRELVSGADWKLRFDQTVKRFRLSEVRQDDIIDYNIELLSDSIKRFFFYGAILMTSKDAVLAFDEPDVQAFPPYPKELGRMIAEDETNQFFLTTHNPYILSELAEKTPKVDLAIFVCRRDPERGTEAHLLDDGQVQDVIEWGADTFFNLSKFDW